MILLLGGEKGGTGKTTLAVNLAVARAGMGAGRDVLLVDADRQGSATYWSAVRAQEGIQPRITCVALYGEGLADQVRAMAGKFDDVVIDTHGADSAELRQSMLVAHRLVTPVRVGQFDGFTMDHMDRLVGASRHLNPHLDAVTLVNAAPSHPVASEIDEMREHLADLAHYRRLATVVKDRKAFRRVAREGIAVCEDGLDPKAIAELQALTEEVWA